MAERVQKTKTGSKRATEEAPQESKVKDEKVEELKEHTDDLLDAIDEILEENAQDFVANYIQRGGQ